LNDAGKALEDAFFAKENARLLQQLRDRATQQERRAAMREVVRVDDDALIDRLIALGLEPGTVLALQLVPLATVVWADGQIEPRERDAVLKAAAAQGVTADSVAGQMLNRWLVQQPSAELVDAWTSHMRALAVALAQGTGRHPRVGARARAQRGGGSGRLPRADLADFSTGESGSGRLGTDPRGLNLALNE
jgi:hypothetical protein